MVKRTYRRSDNFVAHLQSPTEAELNTAYCVIVNDEYELIPIKNNGWFIEYVVDVGCNIGSFTVFAKMLWPNSQVLAVEPCLATKPAFLTNTQAFTSVLFHEQAATSTNTEYEQLLRMSNSTHGILKRAGRLMYRDSELSTKDNSYHKVKAGKLSDLLVKHRFPYIDILKIDAEGSETDILLDLAANGWLSKTGATRIEWHGNENLASVCRILENSHVLTVDGRKHAAENGVGLVFGHVWDEQYKQIN
jgi:FkbM family methyltransferase